MELVVSFKKDDTEMRNALEDEFGSEVQYEESKNFDGLDIFLTAIVPIAALNIQIVDFILTHFYSKEDDKNTEKRRILISQNGSISLTGYTEKEARRIIECYFENQAKEYDS